LTFIAGVAIVGQWFSIRRGLAMGIAVAGSGVGQFAVSQWTMSFIMKFGWRNCLRLNALINFVGLAICSSVLIRKVPLNPLASPWASIALFRDSSFRLLYAANACFSMSFFMPFTYLPIYAIHQGISISNAVLILSVSGIAGVVGRISLGFITDFVGKIQMLQFTVLSAGVTLFCWLACHSFPSLLTIGISYGVFSGGIMALIPVVCAERFGVQSLSSVVGLLFTANTIGNLVSTPLVGEVLDATGNYETSIAIAASFFLFAAMFYFFISPLTDLMKDEDVSVSKVEEATDQQMKKGSYELVISEIKV
jgi:predicted MFS family arabinose efflux permease